MFRKQKYSCCQLIAAINARIILGGPDVTDDEYEELADLVFCRNGAAIHIEQAWKRLGLIVENGPVDTMDLEWVKTHLPVEISYPDPKLGFHAALVIAVEGDEVVLVNSFWERKKWAEIEFYPHNYNRKMRSFTSAIAPYYKQN